MPMRDYDNLNDIDISEAQEKIMENYIMLNGKKIQLTEEQVKLIHADEPKKSPFDRRKLGEQYYLVYSDFSVSCTPESEVSLDDERFIAGNYCTDKNIMKQHALHMMLNNLLWRYSMTHGGDEIEWDDHDTSKYNIYCNVTEKTFYATWNTKAKNLGTVYFPDEETAEAAIEEIVKPFIEAHPEFDVTKM